VQQPFFNLHNPTQVHLKNPPQGSPSRSRGNPYHSPTQNILIFLSSEFLREINISFCH